MKITMLTTYAGPLGCFQPGQDPPIPDSEKRALVAGGFAKGETADAPPPVQPVVQPEETATVAPAETRAAGRKKK